MKSVKDSIVGAIERIERNIDGLLSSNPVGSRMSSADDILLCRNLRDLADYRGEPLAQETVERVKERIAPYQKHSDYFKLVHGKQ